MESLEINGWKIYFHGCFTEQLLKLRQEVNALKASNPHDYLNKRPTKLLAAIMQVIECVASDPLGAQFRLGNTLGPENKHWFRANFLQQYRLFFRCSDKHKTIVIAWVNDEKTKRAYDSKTDAYKVFESMLNAVEPPDNWDTLLCAATKTR